MKRVKFLMAMNSFILLFLAGCGGGGGVEGVVSAGGTVTLDGKPVSGATVSFAPDGAAGRHATGLSDENGKFQLTTLVPGDGAVPGRYKISVSKVTVTVDNKPTSQEEGMRQIKERLQKGGEAAILAPAGKSKDELPTKYSKTESSGLFAEIQASGKNDIPLNLKSSG